MQLTLIELCDMLEDKIELMEEIEEETHIKAYKFILKMAKIGLPSGPNSPKTKSQVKPDDVKMFKEMQMNIKCLGLENFDITEKENKIKKKVPKHKFSTKIIPFFEEEG